MDYFLSIAKESQLLTNPSDAAVYDDNESRHDQVSIVAYPFG